MKKIQIDQKRKKLFPKTFSSKTEMQLKSPPFMKGAKAEFSNFSKKEVSDFFHKKEGVAKIEGYFNHLFSY